MGTEQHDPACDVNEPTTNVPDNIASRLGKLTTNGPDVNNENGKEYKPNEGASKADNALCIHREDVVRSNKSGAVGIVREIAGDSDSDSSMMDDDDDDDDNDNDYEEGGGDGSDEGKGSGNMNQNAGNYKSGALQADQVRVVWMDETEPVQNTKDVTVIDRGFFHGDFVASASDPTGQVGVVLDFNISVDLLADDGSVIENVSSRNLKRVRDFTLGDYVVHGPWLGRIDDILDNVTVLFDDGSLCKVLRAEPSSLKPSSKCALEDDGHFPYYPGQRVKASSSSVFKNSRWLSGFWKANRLEGTVINVTAGSVFVYWIASAGYGPDSSTSPAEEQSPKSLKLLSCFAHANWRVGDWCLLPQMTHSSSTLLNKGMSKLRLGGSIKNISEHSQPGSGCDSEDTQEESNENSERMDFDQEPAPDSTIVSVASEASSERGPCSTSLDVSKESVHEHRPLHRKKFRKVVIRKDKKTRKKEENFEKALLIVNSRTSVDVAWQDGTTDYGLNAATLIAIDNLGDHEFVTEQYVVEKASDYCDDTTETRRVGVVKSVSAKDRTACVRWLKPVDRAEDPREFEKEEVVSVYELDGHPDYNYCYGDVVVRLSPVSISSQSSYAGVEEPNQHTGLNDSKQYLKKNSGSMTAEDATGHEACTETLDYSWVGNITGLKNGDIEVTWADGLVSTVGPQAIYVVGRDGDDDSIAAGSEVSDAAASWETVNDDEMDVDDKDQEVLSLQDLDDGKSDAEDKLDNNSGRNAALALPLAAIGFVTRLATGIFSQGQKSSDSISSESRGDNESQGSVTISERRDSADESGSQRLNIINDCGVNSTAGKEDKEEKHDEAEALGKSESEAVEALCSLRAGKSKEQARHEESTSIFKRFDISTDPRDHYYLGTNEQENNNRRKWFKKIQQDWNILQNNLPDGIYVRVYEDRMDLLRAVIVGAYGTPYQDGLFFFDFHLPSEYPDVPPSTYYHSGGWRINPNLYEEGKVCLSLLNTWTGRGNEVWDPVSSSILQVLVSLQGLVLNSKPYFNEAGYDKQIGTAEGEKNSLSYNENTFLLNCKTIMHLIRKPPKDFEELVIEHFRRRGYYILKACDAYMKGYLIGSLTEDASVTDEDNANSTSVGFKLMLAKIVPKLFVALSEIGADCHEFQHLQQS